MMPLEGTQLFEYLHCMEKSAQFNLPARTWSKVETDKYLYAALTEKIIGCAIAVHRELGPGFLESVYDEAIAIELGRQHVPYQRQVPVGINYHGASVGKHRIDLIVDEKVVVELKAVKEIDEVHLATCISYLNATKLRVGLILNFSREKTRVRRVIRSAEFTAEAQRGRDHEEEFFG